MPLNVAVVGVGFMGQLHARTLNQIDGTQLAAVVDRNETVGRDVASSLGVRYCRSVDDAVTDESIDAFVVALPDRAHVDASITLLRAGRAVLLEKPMAHTLTDATSIAAAADEGGARLMVGQLLRFDPRYAAAAQAVADGEVGEVLHVRAGRFAARQVGIRMAGTSSVLFYLGIHDADAIQWITGHRIVRVYSNAVSKLMSSMGISGEDAILSNVVFDDASVGQLFNGWTRTESDSTEIDGRLELFGTNGSIELDVRDHGLRITGRSGRRVPDGLHWPEVNGSIRGDLPAEVSHFADAIKNSKPFVISVSEALRAVAVNDAILRSLASGLPEDVDEIEA